MLRQSLLAPLFFELMNGLPARDADGTIDDGAFGNSDAARDDVRVYDRCRANLKFPLDDEFAGDSSSDDCSLRVHLTFPCGTRRHVEGAAYTTIAAYRAADDQWPSCFDVAR